MQNVLRPEWRGKMIRNPWRAWQREPKFADLARWSAHSAAWVVAEWEWAA